MKYTPFDLIAPHYCCSCGVIGQILCDSCKENIISQPLEQCLVCMRDLAGGQGVCEKHKVPFRRAWCVGRRSGGLKELIGAYKHERVARAAEPLVEVLDARLPALPESVAVVPVPTIAPHVRQRGYDNTARLAKRLAKRRNIKYRPLLERQTYTVQHTASRAQRFKQAQQAFRCSVSVAGGTYLLVDDIYTTGATLTFAAQVLLDAGAEQVWVAVLARQTTKI